MTLHLDLRRKTLALAEPFIRVIDAKTGAHVASIMPDEKGDYTANVAAVFDVPRELAAAATALYNTPINYAALSEPAVAAIRNLKCQTLSVLTDGSER